MKKAAILILMILTINGIIKALSTPEWVTVNDQEVSRCTIDMMIDTKLICD